MTRRLPVFLGLLALGLGLAWIGGWPFRLMVAAAAVGLILETSVAAGRAFGLPFRRYLWLDLIFFGSCPLVFASFGVGPFPLIGLACCWFAALLFLFPPTRAGLTRWLFSSVVQPYLLLGVFCFFFLRDFGRLWPILAIGIVAVADTGAYFVGRAAGRRLLAPSISPAKTVEGALGGMVLAGALILAVLTRDGVPSVTALGIAAGLSVLAVLGDLFESFLKRGLGLKDFGSSLPGHGGIFDRLDSLLAVSIGLFLFLKLV